MNINNLTGYNFQRENLAGKSINNGVESRIVKNQYTKVLTQFKLTTVLFLCLTVLFADSCKKFIQVPAPTTSLSSNNVYTTDQTAIAVLNGIYIQMSQYSGLSGYFNPLSTSAVCGLSADELEFIPAGGNETYALYFTNQLNPQASNGGSFYDNIYPLIYSVNSAIAGLNTSTVLTPAVKQQLIGEAEFIRAYLNFYLVNLYGDVPLALTTDYKTNATLPRSPQQQVYQQIITDLLNSKKSLSSNFLDVTLLASSPDRLRPTKWAADALLARVYLYYGNLTNESDNYKNATAESDTIINNTTLFGLSDPNNVFLQASLGNNEPIWQIEPVQPGYPVNDALLFVLPTTGPNSSNNPVWLNSDLVKAFEPGDLRKKDWIDSVNVDGTVYYYPYKFKNNVLNSTINEYYDIFRLGEIYLIRAEAEANNNLLAASVGDLNAIRTRAGIPNYSGVMDQTSILQAIMRERRIEFFSEMGHRWLDLKRTGTVNSVMSLATPKKGGTWNANWALYPIPLDDIQYDPNLKQNPGY